MCGRFTITDPGRIRDAFSRFRFDEFSEFRLPRFNVAPTQMVPGVRAAGIGAVEPFQWGTDGRINTRAESLTAGHSPQRCIVLADGFYEWSGGKPVFFSLRERAPFAFAGTWDFNAGAVVACSILTCVPNELVAPVHHRMPVILAAQAIDRWLAPGALSQAELGEILRAFDGAQMQAQPASTRLNNARYDAPDVLTHADPVQQTLGLM